jgi:tRNA 2-thiouridine synthesizing protein A
MVQNVKITRQHADQSEGRVRLAFMTVALGSDRVLDARGQFCPAFVLRAREEIDQLENGQVLQGPASNPASREDITRWAKRAGHKLLELGQEGSDMTFLIRRS